MEKEDCTIRLDVEKIFGSVFTDKQYKQFRKANDYWEVIGELSNLPCKRFLKNDFNLAGECGMYTYKRAKNETKAKQLDKALERLHALNESGAISKECEDEFLYYV